MGLQGRRTFFARSPTGRESRVVKYRSSHRFDLVSYYPNFVIKENVRSRERPPPGAANISDTPVSHPLQATPPPHHPRTLSLSWFYSTLFSRHVRVLWKARNFLLFTDIALVRVILVYLNCSRAEHFDFFFFFHPLDATPKIVRLLDLENTRCVGEAGQNGLAE